MTHDNPYDQREADWRDEDLRQRRAEEAEEAENERRQLGPLYWAALDLPDDLTHNQNEDE